MKSPLVVNGFPLTLGYVGLATYTQRLCQLLVGVVPPNRMRVLVPAQGFKRPEGLPAEIFEPVPICIPPGFAPLSGLLSEWAVSRHVARNHSKAIFFSPGPFSAPLPGRSIVVLHDVIYRSFSCYDGRFLFRRYLNRLPELFARRASRVLTVSHFSKTQLTTLAGISEEKVFVVHNWLDEEFFEKPSPVAIEQLSRKYGLPERFWLYIGGYDQRKNVEFLIRAYSAARGQTACPPLVLAGNIPRDTRKPYCRVHDELQRLSLGTDQVILPGSIDQEDMSALYKAASLMIFPSLMEGFGYTLAEALTCGCPAYVADNSALREIVDDPEYRFPTSDPGVLAAKLVAAAAQSPPPNSSSIDLTPKRALAQLMPLLESL